MRKDSVAIVILAVLGLSDGPAWSQSYPAKPVRIIVPFPAGGAADIFARLIGRKLGESSASPSWWTTGRAHPALSDAKRWRDLRLTATRF